MFGSRERRLRFALDAFGRTKCTFFGTRLPVFCLRGVSCGGFFSAIISMDFIFVLDAWAALLKAEESVKKLAESLLFRKAASEKNEWPVSGFFILVLLSKLGDAGIQLH